MKQDKRNISQLTSLMNSECLRFGAKNLTLRNGVTGKANLCDKHKCRMYIGVRAMARKASEQKRLKITPNTEAFMIRNTKYNVTKILESIGGLPEECAWIDYKAVKSNIDKKCQKKIKNLVVAFLNSLHEFGHDKFIIFGICEDKARKTKSFEGLNGFKFPDDNEWQNLFDDIKPVHPLVETGVCEHKGYKYGYIYISNENTACPYHYVENGKDVSYIRRGGNKYDELTDYEKTELKSKVRQHGFKSKLYPKTDILCILTILGQFNESNKDDICFIEHLTGFTYEDIKGHCIRYDTAFSSSEKSIFGLGSSIKVEIMNKNERLLQFSSDELSDAITIISNVLKSESFFSEELILGAGETLVFLSNNGFRYISEQIVEKSIDFDTLINYRYRNIVHLISEAHPSYILKLVVENIGLIENRQYHCSGSIVQALRVVAWFPEYYNEATQLLLHLNHDYCHELFGEGSCTAATFEQKTELLRAIGDSATDKAFEILNKILDFNPRMHKVLSQSYIPDKYKRMFEHERPLDNLKLQEYYSLFIEYAGRNTERLLKLLPAWLKPYPFCNMEKLINHLEYIEPEMQNANDRKRLWYRLCIQPLVYIMPVPLEQNFKNRLCAIGEKFKPANANEQGTVWFTKDIIRDLVVNGEEYDSLRTKVYEKQKDILVSIYKQNGIKDLLSFINSIDYIERQPKTYTPLLLSDGFNFTLDDENELVLEFVHCPEKYRDYFSYKSYNNLDWVKSLAIARLCTEEKLTLFSVMNHEKEFIKYYEAVLGNNKKLLWERVEGWSFTTEFETLKYAFQAFVDAIQPQKAFDLLRDLHFCRIEYTPDTLEWLFAALMSITDYPTVHLPDHIFGQIYKRLLYSNFDKYRLLQLEELSFCLYPNIHYEYQCYNDLLPQITFNRIVSDANVFVDYAQRITTLFTQEEHLINHCNRKPDNITQWDSEITCMMAAFDDVQKSKIEKLEGRILYNALETVEDKFTISDEASQILDESPSKLNGFCYKFYYPYGFHISGSFESDSKNRDNAKKLRMLASDKVAYMKFSNALNDLANALDKSVETEFI